MGGGKNFFFPKKGLKKGGKKKFFKKRVWDLGFYFGAPKPKKKGFPRVFFLGLKKGFWGGFFLKKGGKKGVFFLKNFFWGF
ncbi:MAG: hypothetical protein CM15mP51_19670 [Porticoccaceae bacterium]|nr:MAG: hypothetical protein CM15mP51_19670 [Porticoccaceae bacterium]